MMTKEEICRAYNSVWSTAWTPQNCHFVGTKIILQTAGTWTSTLPSNQVYVSKFLMLSNLASSVEPNQFILFGCGAAVGLSVYTPVIFDTPQIIDILSSTTSRIECYGIVDLYKFS